MFLILLAMIDFQIFQKHTRNFDNYVFSFSNLIVITNFFLELFD